MVHIGLTANLTRDQSKCMAFVHGVDLIDALGVLCQPLSDITVSRRNQGQSVGALRQIYPESRFYVCVCCNVPSVGVVMTGIERYAGVVRTL